MTRRRVLAVLLLAFAVVFSSTGCAIGDRLDARSDGATESRTMVIDGEDRVYRVHIPGEFAADPALVVMMHGGVGSAEQAERAYGWNVQSETAGFVVAYPDGVSRTWNAGDCCGGAARDGIDDVAFITALVDDLRAEFGVASDRVFATGMSNGAMMTYRLACETDLFAAIAPVAGTIVTDCAAPAPASVLHIHGLDDSQVRMDGGPGDGIGDVDGMPIADAVEVWRLAGACENPVITEEWPVTSSTSGCDDGRRVILMTVADAGHQWPGSVAREGAADQPSDALDATAVIWEFFDGS
jgi:polyhydroxybutyrate depolymerase